MAILNKTLNEGLTAKLVVGRYSNAVTPGWRLEVGKCTRTGKSEAEFVDLHALDHFAPRLMASISKREAGEFMRATQRKGFQKAE